MSILITGANGQLGMSLRDRAHTGGFIFSDIVDMPGKKTVMLDITNLDAVRTLVRTRKVDAIVNCAGYTNVDAAEDHPDLAERLNALAVENLAFAMKEVNGLLVHISTDYVFGGKPCNAPIPENRTPAPTSVYGLSKLHGEQAVRDAGCRHIILRTAWLYSEYGKNFVHTMFRLTAREKQVKVVFDQVGSPTYAGDLAAAILKILEIAGNNGRLPYGIYHYTGEGVCSWYDFATAIAAYSWRNNCEIIPCHSWEFPSKVQRPAYSVLDKTKIKETFGLRIPHWTESLKICMNNILQG